MGRVFEGVVVDELDSVMLVVPDDGVVDAGRVGERQGVDAGGGGSDPRAELVIGSDQGRDPVPDEAGMPMGGGQPRGPKLRRTALRTVDDE